MMSKQKQNREQKTILITGGSRGIGRAIAIGAVAKGYRVLITYNSGKTDADETIALAHKERADAKIFSYQLDIKNFDTIEPLVDRLIEEHEQIDALVNNAAILRDNIVALMSSEDWHEVIDTNLNGPFYLMRALLMHFISQRYGRIVNIASLSAHGSLGQANYATSKAGLIALTATVAREYGRKNITANCVIPGRVETDMVRGNTEIRSEEEWVKYSPIGRTHMPSEIADAVLYLISDAAVSITGEVLNVTGGINFAP